MADLQSISGLGNTYEAKLEEAGISSINALANAAVEDVTEAGIPESTAGELINKAQREGVLIESGPQVEQEQSSKSHVSTGMQAFDRMLGGGWEPGLVYGTFGEHKAGKTQLMFQSIAAAARFAGPAVYIETEEERFRADRVKAMCDSKETYEQIYRVNAHSLDQQRVAYDAVKENFDDVALVVVDSFTANFRMSGKFSDRSDLPDRSTAIADHLNAIFELTKEKECPVLLTLQVMGNPKAFDSSVPIWGGMLMEHGITCFVFMSQSKGNLREAQLRGHPGLPDDEVTIKITDTGLQAIDD